MPPHVASVACLLFAQGAFVKFDRFARLIFCHPSDEKFHDIDAVEIWKNHKQKGEFTKQICKQQRSQVQDRLLHGLLIVASTFEFAIFQISL